MKFGLIFANGPTPPRPGDARTLGYEERKLGELVLQHPETFDMFCHRASVPELVAFVRSVGRDCTYAPFAETQALLRVRAES